MGSLLLMLFFVTALLPPGAAISAEAGGGVSARTIIDLQPYCQSASMNIQGGQGQKGVATLIDLNPRVRGWYLLKLAWEGAPPEIYHLENSAPRAQKLELEEDNPRGLVIVSAGEKVSCSLFGAGARDDLRQARRSGTALAPLCGGRLFLRNSVKGHRTAIESVTDFLRHRVPGGEEVVSFVRDTFFTYVYQKKAEGSLEPGPQGGPAPKEPLEAPAGALIDRDRAGSPVKPVDLGIDIEGPSPAEMVPGAWYGARGNPGIYASVLVPGWIAPEIMGSYRDLVNPLDRVEREQLVYLVAFDLSLFNLHYTLGTDHPGVGWSAHISPRMRDASMPGPDGIGTSAPLVRTGLVSPTDAKTIAATFTGGFKRHHGAFKYGELSLRNHGSHYGFMEEGTLFSTLQPGLATIYALDDGWVDMATWSTEANKLLPRIVDARQNGVPLIERFDEARRISVPGALVARWGPGNWSGSTDEKLQTMRGGIALQEQRGRRFLIYAFFWSVTPSAMTRVFQAYQCRYAMLIDMNALVHTYLAVYRREGPRLYVQHLIKGMRESDLLAKGQYMPRFLGFADDRDFFSLTRKEKP